MSTVALFGVGGVGSLIARGLVARPGVDTLWLLGHHPDSTAERAAELRILADNLEHNGMRICSAALDLADGERVEGMLESISPDLVIHAAAPRSWFAIASALPRDVWAALYRQSGFGPWLPINLAFAMKLMRACRSVGREFPVINVCYPDVVNAVLHRVGLAPTCGAGNSETLASVLRMAAAALSGRPGSAVRVSLLAHHYHLAHIDLDDPWRERAFWYRVEVDGVDETEGLVAAGLVDAVRRICPHHSSVPVAASAVKNAFRLLRTTESIGHCSAPVGRGGGYDVRMGRDGVEVMLPEGLTEQDASRIVEDAQRGDGIESIEPHGDVVFEMACAEAMRTWLGYDCARLAVDEVEERAGELLTRFDELVARVR